MTTTQWPAAPPPPPVLGPWPPRYGEPGWTVWPRRVWPIDPLARAPRRFVWAALVVALLGTCIWRPSVLSVGYLVVAVMVFGLAYGTADRRPTRGQWLGAVLTLALLAVPALLAAEWLGGLCLAAAWVVGWVVGGEARAVVGRGVAWVAGRVSEVGMVAGASAAGRGCWEGRLLGGWGAEAAAGEGTAAVRAASTGVERRPE